jgi:hypothetical protein
MARKLITKAMRNLPSHNLANKLARLGMTALLLGLVLYAPVSRAATPLDALRYSADISVSLAGITVDDADVAEDNLAGTVTAVFAGTLPAGADLDAYHLLANGDQLLSFDTSVALPGGLTAAPADVLRFDGSGFSLEFDAVASGLPRGANTDAVSIVDGGDLLLSFDTTVQFNGFTTGDEDLVSFDGVSFGLFVDGSAAGVASGLDLDAVHYLASNGHLLVSFDGSGALGGVAFGDEDVLEFAVASGVWELAYDGSVGHAGWRAADLDALYATAAFVDQDGDGIGDSVDGEFVGGVFVDQSGVFSDSFTDRQLGGTSFGSLLDRGTLLVTVADAPAADGLRVEAAAGGGAATIDACGSLLQLSGGDSAIVTCGSIKVQVLAGPIEIIPYEGIRIAVPSGATVTVTELAEGEFAIDNSAASSNPVTVTSGDQLLEVTPGNSATINAPPTAFELEIERARFDFKNKAGGDKARIRGRLDPALFNGDGVTVSTEINVRLGPLFETLTMVEKGKQGDRWSYKRPRGGTGIIKRMKIHWKNGKFEIRVDKADFDALTNPLSIGIGIGNHLGEQTILMREKKRRWDYKAPK